MLLPGLRIASTKLASVLSSRSLGSTTTMQHKIKAVIFDMGGVVITGPLTTWRGYEKKVGLPQDSLMNALRGSNGATIMEQFVAMETGKISVDEFEEIFSEHYKNLYPETKLDRVSFISEWGNHSVVFPEIIDAIKCLKAENIKTALLTNNFFFDRRLTQTVLPVENSLFDVVVESARMGMRKPNVEIYNYTLHQLRCQPSEAIFLDDIGRNLKPAYELGMTTIKVTEPRDAIMTLENVTKLKLSGYVPGTTAVRKGMELDEKQLAHYLAPILGADMDGLSLRQFKHGQSNPTYAMSVGNKRFVLRKKPCLSSEIRATITNKLRTTGHIKKRK